MVVPSVLPGAYHASASRPARLNSRSAEMAQVGSGLRRAVAADPGKRSVRRVLREGHVVIPTALVRRGYHISVDEETAVSDLELGSWAPPANRLGRRHVGGTARDRIARDLRSQILMGELRPGDKLDLDLLAKEYGVSPTPIREACLSLAHDKLVKMAPRSGVSIIGVSVVDLKDNFALMAMLAGRAASGRRCVPRRTIWQRSRPVAMKSRLPCRMVDHRAPQTMTSTVVSIEPAGRPVSPS